MEPLNIFVLLVIVSVFIGNLGGAKQGIQDKITKPEFKSNSYLQNTPPLFLALISLLQVIAVFGVTNWIPESFIPEGGRWAAALLFALFSFFQIVSYKKLGKNYSTEIVIFKKHQVVSEGFYKFSRHPQYFFQIVADLCCGIALLNPIIIGLTLLGSLPLLIMRAKEEERLLNKYLKNEYSAYSLNTAFFLPFVKF